MRKLTRVDFGSKHWRRIHFHWLGRHNHHFDNCVCVFVCVWCVPSSPLRASNSIRPPIVLFNEFVDHSGPCSFKSLLNFQRSTSHCVRAFVRLYVIDVHHHQRLPFPTTHAIARPKMTHHRSRSSS